jgi:hypothetical protein
MLNRKAVEPNHNKNMTTAHLVFPRGVWKKLQTATLLAIFVGSVLFLWGRPMLETYYDVLYGAELGQRMVELQKP